MGLFLVTFTQLSAQKDTLHIMENGEMKVYDITYLQRDTVNGMELAVFSSDTSQKALQRYWKNGTAQGRYLSWYPNGNYRMTCVYGYGPRHGDFSLYSMDGKMTIKGKYKNGIAHGYWNFIAEGCRGKIKNGKRHGKWKCLQC